MDRDALPENGQMRFSNSPRRYTQVIQSPDSPRKSLYPEHEISRGNMESIYSQPSRANMTSIYSQSDIGHRTADFFEEDTSDEDETGLVTGEAVGEPVFDSREMERAGSPTKNKRKGLAAEELVPQCSPAGKRVTMQPDSPDSQGYHRLDSNLHEQVPNPNRESTISTAFSGSIEEIMDPPPMPQSARRWASDPQFVSRMSADSSKLNQPLDNQKLDQRLGVHQIAYDFLLKGLLNDEEVMRRERPLDSLVNRLSGIRNSMLSPGLQPFDPRSPRDNLFQQGSLDIERDAPKKVHVVPPPIDTETARRSLPAKMVRTPYPRTIRKDFGQSPVDQDSLSTTEPSSHGSSECVLTVSIRSSNRSRKTTITIPASNEFTAVRSTTEHYPPNNFDDEELFRHLRAKYRSLLSTPFRLFSARTLSRVEVSPPRSHGPSNEKGRNEPHNVDENSLMSHFNHPSQLKGTYNYISWCRSSPSPHFEFILTPSPLRILTFLLTVILLAVAAALLWTFLGKNTAEGAGSGGFRDAGDRVTSGSVLGICVLLIGLSLQAGWLGVSWVGL